MWARSVGARAARGETGAGGIVIAAVLYPILGLMVFALMLGAQGWANAQAAVDDSADQAAKAAASQTVTTPSGEMGIDCDAAEKAASVALAASRGDDITGDRINAFDANANITKRSSGQKAQTGQTAIKVECVDPFEVVIPAYSYCPDTGGWEGYTAPDGSLMCKRQVADQYEYYCAEQGSVLVGNKCVTFATIWTCPDGRVVDASTKCGDEVATAACPNTPPLTDSYSQWSGWKLSADKLTCSGTETAYLNPTLDKSCAVYGVAAPSTSYLDAASQDCYKITKEYYCATGVVDGNACRVVSATQPISYNCPSGFTLSGATCTKTTYTYACSNPSHTLSGTTCSYTTTTYPNSYYVYICPSGWTKDPSQPSWCYEDRWEVVATTSPTKGSCPAGYSLNGTGKTCQKFGWVRYRQPADSVYRQGTPVDTTTTYAATATGTTSTAPSTESCPAGYTNTGTRCETYSYVAQSVRTVGAASRLGPPRVTVVDLGAATAIAKGPEVSIDRTLTPIMPTASETSLFSPAPEKKLNTKPIFEEKQFVTSAETRTFYRGVKVEVQDSFQAPLGGALSMDLARSAEASVDQQPLVAATP